MYQNEYDDAIFLCMFIMYCISTPLLKLFVISKCNSLYFVHNILGIESLPLKCVK